MIGSDLSGEVKTTLVECLRSYADLFAWSAVDMPEIFPDICCHHLSINPKENWAAHRSRSQFDEKPEAAEKAVEDLIRANFVKDVKYNTSCQMLYLSRRLTRNEGCV